MGYKGLPSPNPTHPLKIGLPKRKGSFPYHPFPGAFCTHNISVWYILIFGCFLGKNTIPTHQIGYKIVIFWGQTCFIEDDFPPFPPQRLPQIFQWLRCVRDGSWCGGTDAFGAIGGTTMVELYLEQPTGAGDQKIVGKERGVQNGATICFIDILYDILLTWYIPMPRC